MKIYFENTAQFITAENDNGNIVIRCAFHFTDCHDEESLDHFVARHGGPEATASYLAECHKAAP